MPELAAIAAQLAEEATLLDAALPAFLPAQAGVVGAAMAYSLQVGGKRVRPALVLAWCRLAGGDPQAALPLAVALEMIHTYSLIHDDLPCMDNDDTRRGQPSCHKRFGEATALLAGDALLTRAFEIAAGAENLPCAVRCSVIALLAAAAGAQGMIGGQMLDLEYENRAISTEQLREMNQKKTGRLLQAACLLGCAAAEADTAMRDVAFAYAQAVGLLFQITDDILDVTGEQDILGKPIGSDAQNSKSTWASLLGLEGSREYARQVHAQAVNALRDFDEKAGFLRGLADFILYRDR
ncbi:MAG: polyprenyl synthetase family protein [Oscillospiraceae bacterium]|jgi:geranylgeranyl diphosphate synthase type II|nr:polyprenyl synthetase family protein [Oscillospiraceae bacterium]